MFNQKRIKPDKILLWLDENEFTEKDINFLDKYIKKGLEIKFCPNYKSYKKIIPALNLFPESVIIICDDDAYYNKNWLYFLLKENQKYPNEILCHVGTQINIRNKKICPYSEWKNIKDNQSDNNIIPIGVGGTLVRKSFFYKDVCDYNIFMNIVPNADDIWIWAQSALNNVNVRVINNFCFYPKDLGADRNYPKLYSCNIKGGNNFAIEQILNYYPQLKNLLQIE